MTVAEEVQETKESSLPPDWSYLPLSDVVDINPKLDKKQFSDDLAVSFVPMPAVEAESGEIDVSAVRTFGEVKKGYTAFQEGDVLFAKITPCMENGKMAVVPALHNDLGFGSTEFHVLRSSDRVLPKYIYYFVSSKQFRVDAEHNMTGAVGQRRVPTGYLQNIKIPLPPLEQQKRIVVKIEELFSELDNGIAALKTAREQLKIYRQAVLKHAFEGKLTAQWREENQDKLETPQQLLARIQQEREARYQQQLEEWKQAVKEWETGSKEGKKPRTPSKPKNLDKLTELEISKLQSIPSEWGWCKIGEVALTGTGVTPLKSKTYYYESGDIAWVTSGALNDAFVREPSGYVTLQALNETNLRLYPTGTLVVALYGEGKTRGKCSELAIEATTNQAVAAIVMEGGSSNWRGFLKWYLIKNYEDMRRLSSGGVQPNLNLGVIENMAVPLCSIAEAEKLTSLLDQRVSEVDKLDEEIDLQLQKSETLRQSILKKAFIGRLAI